MYRRFTRRLRCFSLSMFPNGNKQEYEKGDKILLPTSALHELTRQNIEYPMLFKIEHGSNYTHCGVLEFSAAEGHMYIPYWIMENLCLDQGTIVNITNLSLPKATFVKLQPQEERFLNLSNPKAVLEFELRKFTCLTQGHQIRIDYLDRKYNIHIKELWPAAACSIIETDCKVEFEAPPGYSPPAPKVVSPPKSITPVMSNNDSSSAASLASVRRKRIQKFSKINHERFSGKGYSLRK